MGPRSPDRPRSRLDLLVWGLPLLGLAIVAGLWLLVLNILASERRQVERDIEQRARGLAQAFEEYSRRGLLQIDQITAFVAHQIKGRGQDGPRDRAAGRADMTALLQLGLADLPGVVALFVTDERGAVLGATPPMGSTDVGDRSYFRVHLENRHSGLYVSEPLLGRSSQRWVLQLTRRLTNREGGFAGVVAVTVDPRYFTDFYRPSQLGRQGMVSLMGLDMVVRARRSGDRLWFGNAAGGHLAEHLRRWPEGSYEAVNRLDGVQRRLAYKTVQGYPLVALVGLALEEARAPFEQRRAELLGLTGLGSALLLLAFGGLSLAAISLRRSQAERERARARFEAASDASLDAFWMLCAERDAQGRVQDFRFAHCNDRGADLLRKPKDEIVGRLRSEVFPEGRDPRFFRMFCEVLESRQPRQAEFVVETPPAAGLCLQHQVVPMGDGVALTTRDVTAERRREQAMQAAQAALQAAEKRLRDITDKLPVLITYIDPQEHVRFLNGTFRAWMDIEPELMLGRSLLVILGAAEYGLCAAWLHRALCGERVGFEIESTLLGRKRWLRNEYMPDIGPTGQVQGVYALSQDISDLKAVQRELEAQVRHDALTGLPNRQQFDELLPQALGRAARSGAVLALLFLDVDKFKSINDKQGHGVGDAVLKEFARRLRESVRAVDTVARLAGDEFVIVLEDLRSEDEAGLVARKITRAMVAPFVLEGHSLQVTTSIGIACRQGGGVTPAELLQRADQALYAAKNAGRNTFRVTRH